MDKNDLRIQFDNAVAQGSQDEAIIYGSDLVEMGDHIHVMLGYKKLQKQGPETNIKAALLYVQLAFQLSRSCRNSSELLSSAWAMNLNETADAANVANMYEHPKFNEYWDYLIHEHICWNIIAAENSTGNTRSEYMAEAKNLMDTTKPLHNGDWIVDYLQFFVAHGI